MNRSMKLGALALALAMATTAMLAGTFAKYTNQYAGADTALVAAWDFNSDELTEGPYDGYSNNLDLFNHTYTNYITQKVTDATGDDRYLIAPGVSGDFWINVDYTGDVDAAVKLAVQNIGTSQVPIQFTMEDVSDEGNNSPQEMETAWNALPDTDIFYLGDLAAQLSKGIGAKYVNLADGVVKPTDPFDALWIDLETAPASGTNTTANEAYLSGNTDGTVTAADADLDNITTKRGTKDDQTAELYKGLDDEMIIARTAGVGTISGKLNTTYVQLHVFWRWPYDVSEHVYTNGKFAKSGCTPITGTVWTDADDTKLGNDSAANLAGTPNARLDYKLVVDLRATQLVPKKTVTP